MQGENGLTLSIINDLYSCEIERHKRAGESGVTRSIIDELHSLDIK